MVVQRRLRGVQDEFGLPRPNFLEEELAKPRLQAGKRSAEGAVDGQEEYLEGETMSRLPAGGGQPAGTGPVTRSRSKWWRRLRHHVQVLAPDGAVVGEVTADGIVYWDPPMPLRVGRVAPMSVRRALATNGRL